MALTWFFTLQVTEQKTDKLVNSTRKILETKYKQVFFTQFKYQLMFMNISNSHPRAGRNLWGTLSLLLTQSHLEIR